MPDPVAAPDLRRRIARARVARERDGASPDDARAGVWADVVAGRFGPVPAGRGWFHEAVSIPDKDAVFARARQGVGITSADLADATRVYTPAPIVRFLLQNTLGAMWCAMHPRSPLRDEWPLLVTETVGVPRPPVPARELRVVDPCCGAGAFLVAAASFLADLIQDEEGTTGDGERRRDALAHAVASGVWGADIDAEAVGIAEEALTALAGPSSTANLRVLPAPEGMLIPDAFGDERFDVVVTNPPYVGSRQMDRGLAARLDAVDGAHVTDLAVAVQRRSWDLVADGGRCGTITPAGWLNDRSSAPLRRRILREGAPRVVARLGQGVFDQAPLVFCSLNVLAREGPGDGWRLLTSDGADEQALAAAARATTTVTTTSLESLPVPPFAPHVPARLLGRLGSGPTVGDFFTTFDGAWTGSHRRDVRAWWEVVGDPDWVPVSGGQGREGWAAGTAFRMRAAHVAGQPDRTGLVEYPRVAGGWLCSREAEPGTAARAGVVTFVPRSEEALLRRDELLAVFNTRIGTAWLRTLTSGLNFNPGYAARIPLAPHPPGGELQAAVREVVALRRLLARRDPASDGFTGIPWPWEHDDLEDRLRTALAAVDRLTSDHLGIPDAEWRVMDPPRPARRRWTAEQDAWMVAALRAAGVRWPSDPDGPCWSVTPVPVSALADAVADAAAASGATAARCDEGRSWVAARLERYVGSRYRRTAPVTVTRGVLHPRAHVDGGTVPDAGAAGDR